MALGADRSGIRGLVVRQGMQLALVGVVVGVAAAFGFTRLISSFLFGVKSWDPIAFVTIPILLLIVALAAVWRPPRVPPNLIPCKPCVSNNQGYPIVRYRDIAKFALWC